jgi:hypothetical protein
MRRRPVSVVNLDHLAGIGQEEPAFRGPLRANTSARRATAVLVDEHGAGDWDTLAAGFDDVSYDPGAMRLPHRAGILPSSLSHFTPETL